MYNLFCNGLVNAIYSVVFGQYSYINSDKNLPVWVKSPYLYLKTLVYICITIQDGHVCGYSTALLTSSCIAEWTYFKWCMFDLCILWFTSCV